ncbi:MAG: hypothetical protein ACYTGW_04605 [Planctomycetota bacterium]|jgi:hypothetical protein
MTAPAQRKAFTWNAGGWYGALLGASCWILIAAGFAARLDVGLALTNLACFATLLVAGVVLWAQRHRRDPYPSIQILMGIAFVVTAAVFLAWDLTGYLDKIVPAQAAAHPRTAYALLLVFPLLMWQFWRQQRNTREGSEGS